MTEPSSQETPPPANSPATVAGPPASSRAAVRTDHSDVPSDGFTAAVQELVPHDDGISTRAFDRVSAAVDASHYLLTPQAVVRPRTAPEVAALIRHARERQLPLTFRSGGTSLSGQAVTDGLLVDTRRHFRDITVLDDGERVRVQPGATVRQVNARLARHARKLGPDPASEIACTVGGVIANNSSGMACGITQNTYRTLESMIMVLPSGTTLNTAAADADDQLRDAEPDLWETLVQLRHELAGDPDLVTEVERQYAMKNTMGYGVNALLDFERPIDILTHLVIGSEGTLAFVAEATFRTVPVHSQVATAFCVFERLQDATDALPAMVSSGAATIELLDAASLRVVQSDPAAEGAIPDIEIDQHAGLLVEYQAPDAETLDGLRSGAEQVFAGLPLVLPASLASDPTVRGNLWHLRKGLYAAVAGSRPSGTTALLEDIAVPVGSLSQTCAALQRLFGEYGYDDAVIFGHAKDGNIHFLINVDFDQPESLDRYRSFTDDMVDLVLSNGGTLKAEHGTGRIMAPFVRRQFGDQLYGMMLKIKSACDPTKVLSPDTLLTSDADLHLKNLKSTATVEEEVDRCVECGYCEPVCPSKDLTTTPRQRIVIRRAIAEAEHRGDDQLAAELRADSDYGVIETCAVDGMCQTACPVMINTGDLVRRLRAEDSSAVARTGWRAAAHAWAPFTTAASAGLSVAKAVPTPILGAPNRLARRLLGDETVPLLSRDLPRGGPRRRPQEPADGEPSAVFFAACVGTMFGPEHDSPGASEAFRTLCDRAGVPLTTPKHPAGLCCGTPWKSKGMSGGYADMINKTLDGLWEASDQGRLPVVCDASSCTEGLSHALESGVAQRPELSALTLVDAVAFTADQLLDRLNPVRRLGRIALHPTCSSTRLGTNASLNRLAEAIADEPVVPLDWGCCAFAGDRGLLHPDLTASATAAERDALQGEDFDAYASNNRTCEIGLTRATGHPYHHILELLEEATRPAATDLGRLSS